MSPHPPSDAHDPVDLTAAGRSASAVIALVTGGLLHLVVGAFVLSSGLLAPAWAATALGLVWVVLWVPIWRWRRSHPFRVLFVPFVMAAGWWLAITAGDRWLGWTA
jgi:hypothetical protein